MPKKTAFRDAIAGAVNTSSGGKPAKNQTAPIGSLGNRKDDRPHRAGLVNVTGYFAPEVKSSIRAIQMKHPNMTQQDILEEALEAIFVKYAVPQTARLHRHTGKKEKAEGDSTATGKKDKG